MPAPNTLDRIKVLDVELTTFPVESPDCTGYEHARALVRHLGVPVGYVDLAVIDGRVSLESLRRDVAVHYSEAVLRRLIWNRIAMPVPAEGLFVRDLFGVLSTPGPERFPLVTVAVCTRDRPEDLARCLATLEALDYPELDLLVVDNAPSDDATQHLVEEQFARIRYVREPRPGLDWARNRAVMEAHGEILAFADDDVAVDRGWVTTLVALFTAAPEVDAVTGLVAPLELETPAQVRFEQHGGLVDLGELGFEPKRYRRDRRRRHRYLTGNLGAGANMAFRRALFAELGLFDPALDVGTVTNGGGDLEFLFRLVHEGYTLAYEPAALVWHRHRRDADALNRQIINNGIGLVSHLIRSADAYPAERAAFAQVGLTMLRWNLLRLARSVVDPGANPRDLIAREMWGFFAGVPRYGRARRTAEALARSHGPVPTLPTRPAAGRSSTGPNDAVAVRMVDLAEPMQPLTDVTGYDHVRVYVSVADCPVGWVEIGNRYDTISPVRLRDAIAARWAKDLVARIPPSGVVAIIDGVMSGGPPTGIADQPVFGVSRPRELSPTVPVSVVVATLDRPDDLRSCLTGLRNQRTPRPVEIVVVDNRPASGKTAPVVREFPGVVLVNESRQGLAYARNAGFLACTGVVAVATDDDVVMPTRWLEKVVGAFADPSVTVATGNVLPMELETKAQRDFERYGGLGKGFERRVFDHAWFRGVHRQAVPTWEIGATANAAFRTAIFRDPRVGLMDEALGPGMPSGVGEDTYLFYRALKAGGTAVYEPAAYVWHVHRRAADSLRRQLWNYSKGHVAYHLTTLLRDSDLRAIPYLIYWLPAHQGLWLLRQTRWAMRRSETFSPWLVACCIAGSAVGPYALWQSRRRVAREGLSIYPPKMAALVPTPRGG